MIKVRTLPLRIVACLLSALALLLEAVPAAAVPAGLPFPPVGHFQTTFLPPRGDNNEQRLHVNGDEVFLIGNQGARLFWSGDQGQTWTIRPHPGHNVAQFDVALSPNYLHDRQIIGLTRRATGAAPALLLSFDGALSWHAPAQPPGGSIGRLRFSPAYASDGIVYATGQTWDGTEYQPDLWWSNDRGEHWTEISGAWPTWFSELLISPRFLVDNTLWVQFTDRQLWRSTNRGQTWTPVNTPGESDLPALAVTKTATGTALAAAAGSGLWISYSQGSSWTKASALVFDRILLPPDSAAGLTIFARLSGDEWLLSPDAGNRWYFPVGDYEIRDIALSPDYADTRRVYAEDVGDLFVSQDGGNTWDLVGVADGTGGRVRLLPVPDQERYPVVFSVPTYLDSPRDWISASVDGGRTWGRLRMPAQARSFNLALSPDWPVDPTMFVALPTTTGGSVLYRSDDGGKNWLQVDGTLMERLTALVVSPNYGQDHTLWEASYGGGLRQSQDGGATWTALTGSLNATGFYVSPAYPADPVLYVTTYNSGTLRSLDGGANWQPLSAWPARDDLMLVLSPDFAQDRTLFASMRGVNMVSLYRSSDGGDTWQSAPPPTTANDFVSNLVISPQFARDQTLGLAVDYGGVYISENGGQSWSMPPDLRYPSYPDLALTYRDGLIQPLVGAPEGVYYHHWPTLTVAPKEIVVAKEPGQTGEVTFSLHVRLEQPAPATAVLSGATDWLAIEPITSTLPVTASLRIELAHVTGTVHSDARVDIPWSLHQASSTVVPVSVFEVRSRTWLPLLAKEVFHSQAPSQPTLINPQRQAPGPLNARPYPRTAPQ